MWPFSKRKSAVGSKRSIFTPISGFNAAGINRLTASSSVRSQSMDWDLYKSLNILRARSRDVTVNNPHGKKFLQMVSGNVVGATGFDLTIDVKETTKNGTVVVDNMAAQAIEAAFWDWGRCGVCDVTGMHSFFDICNLFIKAVARDGETIVRKIYGAAARNKYGFALQILDVERLDVLLNRSDLVNGNIIKMGVELNKYGRPVAYHIRVKHPGDTPYYTYEGTVYERVPFEELYHCFISDRPEQNRGIPWMHATMLSLTNLGGYEEAAVIAARVGASKMGFFTSPDGDGTALADSVGDSGELLQEADPGVFGVLPEGYEFQPFNPDYPHAMFDAFMKACLRSVASGLGVSYNSLASDLEGVNFSSIRAGVLEERDNWMAIQRWMIEKFLDSLFSEWLKWALLSGAIVLPNGSALPVGKFDKFNKATWHGRRWQWVDPLKDVEASVKSINNGLKSRRMVASEQGVDLSVVLTQLAEEEKAIAAAGITIEKQNSGGAAPQQQPDAEKGDEKQKGDK